VFEKLGSDNCADRVAPLVLGTGVAAPITKEAGDRVTAAGGERSAKDVEVGHGPSIAQVNGPIAQVNGPIAQVNGPIAQVNGPITRASGPGRR